MSDNNFIKLASIDVGDKIEKKQNLSYLSWAWAVDHLMRHDPMANWTFHAPQMYGETMMVSCTVTAFGKPLTMHLPVMDHRNQAIKNPDAFAVNKNMMRCLVKAIACHGLGLYIYAGEDLPEGAEEEKPAPKAAPKPAAKPAEAKPPAKIEGKTGPWQLTVTTDPDADFQAWIGIVLDATRLALGQAANEKDVMDIFKVNRVIFDRLKADAPEDYTALMADFTKRKNEMKEQSNGN